MKTETIDTAPSAENNKGGKSHSALGLALILVSFGAMAAAPTSGDFLYGVYNEVMGWLTGAPGIIISVVGFGVAAWQGLLKGNYFNCAGAFIIAMLFANAQDAIEYFLTAGVPVNL